MPTGYTASLERKDFNLKRWLKEDIVRAFGVCMHVRDEGDMTEEALRESLKKRDEEKSLYEDSFKKDVSEHEKYLNMPLPEYTAYYEAEKEKAQKYYDERFKKFENGRKKTLFCIKTVSALLLNPEQRPIKGELIVNALGLAREQLRSGYDFDYRECYKPDILSLDVHAYRRKHLDTLFRTMEYRREDIDRETKKGSLLESYDEYATFIDGGIKKLAEEVGEAGEAGSGKREVGS
jgi:hypothetical protein